MYDSRVVGQWVKKDGGIISENGAKEEMNEFHYSNGRADSTSEIAFEPKELGKKFEQLSVGASEDITWKVTFSNDEFMTGLSSSRSEASNIRPKKKSLDFRQENLNFDEVFTVEKFSIDHSPVYSTFVESPNSILIGTDKKKLYRFKTSSRQKEMLFDSRLLIIRRSFHL